MNSIADGKHPPPDDVQRRIPTATSLSSNRDQHGPRAFGFVQDAQGCPSVTTPNCLQSRRSAPKIQSARVQIPPPTSITSPSHTYTNGDRPSGFCWSSAVFQTMRAARIHRDITRDGHRPSLLDRVRRVKQASPLRPARFTLRLVRPRLHHLMTGLA